MPAFDLLFGADGWASLLLKGAVVTVLLSLATIPSASVAGWCWRC